MTVELHRKPSFGDGPLNTKEGAKAIRFSINSTVLETKLQRILGTGQNRAYPGHYDPEGLK